MAQLHVVTSPQITLYYSPCLPAVWVTLSEHRWLHGLGRGTGL